MKKIKFFVMMILIVITAAFGLTACSGKKNEQTHTHNYVWVDNGDGTHKQHCTVDGCDKPDINVGGHEYGEKGKCVCGAIKPAEHKHAYTQQVAESKYMKTAATCKSKAVYYYSCECGETGTETFEHGGLADHMYGDLIAEVPATCQSEGTKAHYHCDVCGKDFDTNKTELSSLTIAKKEHSYTEQVAESKYLKTAATCMSKAVYYYSCVCGEIGAETFEYGELSEDHPFKNEWYSDDEYHYHKSSCSHAIVKDKAEHSFDTSGKCSVCNRKKPSEGLSYTYNSKKEEYILSGVGSCNDAQIVIPSVYNNKPVTSIGYRALAGYSTLTSVTIPDSVTKIGDYALSNCSKLTSITIPNGVTDIGKGAFSDCKKVTSIIIPNSVTSIGDNAFYNCTSLKYNKYNDSNYLGNNDNPYVVLVKAASSSITRYKINEQCRIIYPGAFAGSNSLKYNEYDNAYYLGNGENEYFALIKGKTVSITSCEINKDCKIICSSAFSGYSLESVNIPEGVVSIGYGAFSGCTNLVSITIPNSVNDIGGRAFQNDTSLENITISNGVTNIGNAAFYNCVKLAGITIPNSVEILGDSAFYHCFALKSIVIPDSVTEIGREVFNGCSGLVSATVPDSVTSIGNSSFSYCSSLETITIPDSVTNIGNDAFIGCSSLVSVTISNRVTDIGSSAFKDCTSLPDIIIPESVTIIRDSLFQNCTSLASVTMSTANLSNSAFASCGKLTQITFTGTKAQWSSGFKKDTWHNGVPSWCKIHCSDGDTYI